MAKKNLAQGLQEGLLNYATLRSKGGNDAMEQAKTLALLKKTGVETEKDEMSLGNMKKWSGPSLGMSTPSLGVTTPPLGSSAPAPAQNTQDQYLLVPDPSTGTYKQVPNKNFMSTLDQARTTELQTRADERKSAGEQQDQNLTDSAQEMLGTIGKVKEGAKYFGPMGNLPSGVAALDPRALSNPVENYGKRADWESNVNKLLSGRVIEIMTKMKNASKTGATGFGSMSEKELAVLQNASTALKKNLNPEEALGYLNALEGTYKKVLGQSGAVPPAGATGASKSKYTIEAVG